MKRFCISQSPRENHAKIPWDPVLPRLRLLQRHTLFVPIPFESVFDYLCYLREVCVALRVAGLSAMLCLAAAASDFYLPPYHLTLLHEAYLLSGTSVSLSLSISAFGLPSPQNTPPLPVRHATVFTTRRQYRKNVSSSSPYFSSRKL